MNNKVDLILSLNLDGKAEKIIRKYIQELEDRIESMKSCSNCNPLDIFDCEGCKYIGNGDSDNWIGKE